MDTDYSVQSEREHFSTSALYVSVTDVFMGINLEKLVHEHAQ